MNFIKSKQCVTFVLGFNNDKKEFTNQCFYGPDMAQRV